MTSLTAMSGATTAPAKTRKFGWLLRRLRPSGHIAGYDFVIAFAAAAGMAAAYPLFAG